MKTHGLRLTALAISGLLIGAACSASMEPDAPTLPDGMLADAVGSLRARVIDRVSKIGYGLPDIPVSVRQHGRRIIDGATDETGDFAVEDLPAGNYTLVLDVSARQMACGNAEWLQQDTAIEQETETLAVFALVPGRRSCDWF